MKYSLGSLYEWRFAAESDIPFLESCMDDTTHKPGSLRVTAAEVVRRTEETVWVYHNTHYPDETNATDWQWLKTKYPERTTPEGMAEFASSQYNRKRYIAFIISDAVTGNDIGWISYWFVYYDDSVTLRHSAPSYVIGNWIARTDVWALHPSARGNHLPHFLSLIVKDYFAKVNNDLPWRVHSVIIAKDEWAEAHHPYTEKGAKIDNLIDKMATDSDIAPRLHSVDRIRRIVDRNYHFPDGTPMSDWYWYPKNRDQISVTDSDGTIYRYVLAAEVLPTAQRKTTARNSLLNCDSSDSRFLNKTQILEGHGYHADFTALAKDENGLIYFPDGDNRYSVKTLLKTLTADSDWAERTFL